MLLDSNTKKVRLAIIHLLEEHYSSTKYDESFIRLLKEGLEILDTNSKKVITNFAKYKNLLFISAEYMEFSLLEKQKFLVEILFSIFQFDFKNEEINNKINQQLNVYTIVIH